MGDSMESLNASVKGWKSFQLYMFLQSRLDAEWGVFEYVVYTEGVFEYRYMAY